MTFRSGQSLRSGNASFRESAKVFWAKGLSALIPRIWTPSSWNLL
jgi:hypothetical protein